MIRTGKPGSHCQIENRLADRTGCYFKRTTEYTSQKVKLASGAEQTLFWEGNNMDAILEAWAGQ